MSQVEAGRIQLDIVDVKPETIVDTAIVAVSIPSGRKVSRYKRITEKNTGMVKADAEKTAWD
ncbi:MAG: hypothetical protein WDO71_19390 [Bacteroidota bacterium]